MMGLLWGVLGMLFLVFFIGFPCIFGVGAAVGRAGPAVGRAVAAVGRAVAAVGRAVAAVGRAVAAVGRAGAAVASLPCAHMLWAVYSMTASLVDCQQ